jgi:hypothetical protein
MESASNQLRISASELLQIHGFNVFSSHRFCWKTRVRSAGYPVEFSTYTECRTKPNSGSSSTKPRQLLDHWRASRPAAQDERFGLRLQTCISISQSIAKKIGRSRGRKLVKTTTPLAHVARLQLASDHRTGSIPRILNVPNESLAPAVAVSRSL